LHQDLKPQNIFVHNARFKIADFDLSILHEGVIFGTNRQGTFPYMSLEKLTGNQYLASSKSDVYSLGVIFFKLIARHHPYVIGPIKNMEEFIKKLASNSVQISKSVIAKMTIEMKHLFDLINKMITKD
jgi:serine/threonine protein kinase